MAGRGREGCCFSLGGGWRAESAREYQAQGNQLVQPWIDSTLAALTTRTGMTLAKAAQDLSPSVWWDEFAAAYGARQAD